MPVVHLHLNAKAASRFRNTGLHKKGHKAMDNIQITANFGTLFSPCIFIELFAKKYQQ
jgi:hypothetical protein